MRNTLSKTSRPPIPRFRRIQSMAGPVPWDARALRWLACRKRRWKAMGFRAPAKKEDFFDRRESRTPWLHFGDAFLLHGASARQDMLAAVDGLGFSRRDAARAMSLFYALTPQSAGDVGGGKHLRIRARLGREGFEGIFFSHTARELDLHCGDLVDIAFTPQINDFRGHVSVQLLVSAMRRHDGSGNVPSPAEIFRDFRPVCVTHL